MKKYILLICFFLVILCWQIGHAQTTTHPTVNSVTAPKNGGIGNTYNVTWAPSGSGTIFVAGDSYTVGQGPSGVTCASGTNFGAITAVGSLTGNCYADLIGVFYNMPVWNIGVAGATQEHCVTSSGSGCAAAFIDVYAARLVAHMTPNDYVYMMFGANDASFKVGTGSGSTPGEPTFNYATFRANYLTIVNALLAAGIPANHIAIGSHVPRQPQAGVFGNIPAFIGDFNSAAASVALETNVAFIDVYHAFQQGLYISGAWTGGPQQLLGAPDSGSGSNHPTANGYKVIANAIENPAPFTALQVLSATRGSGDSTPIISMFNPVNMPLADNSPFTSLAIGFTLSNSTISLFPPLFSLCPNATPAAYSDIAIGSGSMGGNITTCGTMTTAAVQNIGLGVLSVAQLTSGGQNIGVGYAALRRNSSGSHNVGVGFGVMNGAGTSYMTGGDNTGIGYESLFVAQLAAQQNTAVGSASLNKITTGSANLALGYQVASTTLTTGSNNILAGTTSACDTTAAGSSNEFHLCGTAGDSIKATGMNTLATEAFTLRGTLVLSDIASDATHTDASACFDTTTHMLLAGSGTLGVCLGTSSARYKNNIVQFSSALERLMKLKPVTFNLDAAHGDPKKTQFGFIAEDAVDVFPDLVGLDKEGKPNSFDYVGLISPIVKALQEQQQEISILSPGLAPYHRCVSFLPVLCAG